MQPSLATEFQILPLETAAATTAAGKTKAMTKLRIALVGAAGRMGQAIASVAASENAEIVAKSDLGDRITSADADVLIDFSSAAATEAVCDAADTRRKRSKRLKRRRRKFPSCSLQISASG